jgi:hypothetical protein
VKIPVKRFAYQIHSPVLVLRVPFGSFPHATTGLALASYRRALLSTRLHVIVPVYTIL